MSSPVAVLTCCYLATQYAYTPTAWDRHAPNCRWMGVPARHELGPTPSGVPWIGPARKDNP